MTKQIVCIKWGTKYGPDYVNRLHAMVARWTAPPYRFTCFTDDATGIRPEVDVQDLPPLPCAMPVGTRGKWPKSRLWGPTLGSLIGPVLFMDLDVVVTGPLDGFFSQGAPDDVILARNAAKPFQRLGQTSIFRFPVGALAPLQDRLAADPQGVGETYRYEQFFVTAHAPGGIGFWPRAWVRHFRIECVRTFPLNLVLPARKPAGARVVIFAGRLNPEDAVAGRWAPGLPADRPALDHLRAAIRERRGYRGMRSYVKPTPWVAEAWRD